MVVQWLGLCAFITEGLGSVPGWGTKILQAVQCGQKKKVKRGLRSKTREEEKGRIIEGLVGPGRSLDLIRLYYFVKHFECLSFPFLFYSFSLLLPSLHM